MLLDAQSFHALQHAVKVCHKVNMYVDLCGARLRSFILVLLSCYHAVHGILLAERCRSKRVKVENQIWSLIRAVKMWISAPAVSRLCSMFVFSEVFQSK